jgi:hypothetical protein
MTLKNLEKTWKKSAKLGAKLGTKHWKKLKTCKTAKHGNWRQTWKKTQNL